MAKIFVKSGLSPHTTYLPASIHPKHTRTPRVSMDIAHDEAEMVMCGAVQEVLKRSRLKATDIDFLITCTSIYCPTPSLASMLVNRFKMREDVRTYHLGGMGCGTGVIGVGMVEDLLKANPGAVAMFVPAEITSFCFYQGNEPNRMVSNVLFRMGGAASVFTNRGDLIPLCKYKLLHASRVHKGADDTSYKCMSWGPDKEGIDGVYLSKDVIKCAGEGITAAVRDIAPYVMTWQQYKDAAVACIRKKYLGHVNDPEYKPDFNKSVDHFAIHAGGYAVLRGIREGLQLTGPKMLPSFATLAEYGNTSCSTTWYTMSCIESCVGVSKGQTVLQIGVGGGIKAGCNVWKALKDITQAHPAWSHYAFKPLSEACLPRSMDTGEVRDSVLKEVMEEVSQHPEVPETVRKSTPQFEVSA